MKVSTKCRPGYSDIGAKVVFHQKVTDAGMPTGRFYSPPLAIMADQAGDSFPVGPGTPGDGGDDDPTFLGAPGGKLVITADDDVLNLPVEIPIEDTIYTMPVRTFVVPPVDNPPAGYYLSMKENKRMLREQWGAHGVDVMDKWRIITHEDLSAKLGIRLGDGADVVQLGNFIEYVDLIFPDPSRSTIKVVWLPFPFYSSTDRIADPKFFGKNCGQNQDPLSALKKSLPKSVLILPNKSFGKTLWSNAYNF